MTRRVARALASASAGARLVWVCAFMVAWLPARAQADAPPGWLQQLQQAKTSADPSVKAAAVVLVDEEEVTVQENGRLRTLRRYAVRLQQRDGRDAAAIRQVYYPDAGKAPRLRAWLLRANGDTRELGGDALIDASLSDTDVYNDVRVRAINAAATIAAGDIFGAEVEMEERALFSQVDWSLQGRWPALRVLRRLTLPAGWDAKSVTFNHAAIEPSRQLHGAAAGAGGGAGAGRSAGAGVTLTWQLADLAEVSEEPDMPARSSLVPRVAVSYWKAGGHDVAAGQFGTWRDVSVWLAGLSDAPAAPSDPVARKARELTSGAATEHERIAALARFAQGVPYASIQTGIGRGGGYTPRAAALVLERRYGDCKDKATLLRSMLAAVGVRSWLVSIYSGDPDYVRDSFPSPQQFNHAIVAIALTASIGASSELVHPSLGSLLFFDPTDEATPLGELPLHEQGSLALIVSGRDDSLVRMPLAPADAHKTHRTFTAALDASGGVSLEIRETNHGARAADARGVARAVGASGMREWIERRAAAAFPGSQLLEFDSGTVPAAGDAGRVDDAGGASSAGGTKVNASPSASASVSGNVGASVGVSGMRIRLRADNYAQAMSGRLLLFKPPFAFGGDTPAPAGAARTHPLVLDALSVEDTLELTVPDGITFDELPPAITLETTYGRYTLSLSRPESDARRVVLTRRLDVPRRTVPPAEYAAAKAFFEKVRNADATPIVLARPR